jgi:23S rRNA (pseudouridine1915-N3)-methyltransferase
VHIHLIAVGQKMPAWVEQACNEYIKRLPRELQLDTIEVPIIKRGKNPDIQRIVRDESRKVLASVPTGCCLVALDVAGKKISTETLAANLDNWMQQGQDIAIVIGGPDGLSDELLQQAERTLSLSDMTFPHPLVRIIITEQLYRAWSILNNHPYHRA